MIFLHILLLLLKIIGIILLVFLCLLLLILLVPIRYSFSLEKGENVPLKLQADVGWLLRFIHLSARYADSIFGYGLRILHIPVMGTDKKPRKKKAKRGAKKAVKPEPDLLKAQSENKKPKPEQKIPADSGTKQMTKSPDKKQKEQHPPEKKTLKEKKSPKKKPEEKKSSKLKQLKSRLQDFLEKKEQLAGLPWRDWLEFGRGILGKLLRHILPRKLTGTIAFGFDDPCTTGQVMGAASVLYPVYGGHFYLEPDFNEKKFEADCRGKGRIRLGYLLVLAVLILMNKDVRTLIKKIISGEDII